MTDTLKASSGAPVSGTASNSNGRIEPSFKTSGSCGPRRTASNRGGVPVDSQSRFGSSIFAREASSSTP